MRFAAEIYASVGHRGRGPAGGAELGYLVSGKLSWLFCVEGEDAELTGFTEHDEFAVGLDQGAATVLVRRRAVFVPCLILIPEDFSGGKRDATKTAIRLVAAAEGVKVAFVNNGRHPMQAESLLRGGGLLRGV